MKIMMVDDEEIAIEYFKEVVTLLKIEEDVVYFQKTSEALKYAEENDVGIAFLDIEMPGMSGISLAEVLKKTNPDVVIVFVTAYAQYAFDAFGVDAIGYVLKPYTEAQIQKELIKCKRMRGVTMRNRIYVKTFGGFDIYVDDKPLHFSRSKAKEMLALLVDKRGNSMTPSKIAAYLWEDREYDDAIKDYLKKIYQCLKSTLQEVNAESILIESYNARSINMLNLTCDYYNFLNGDSQAVQQYMGNYMEDYSWAEETNGELYQLKYEKIDYGQRR